MKQTETHYILTNEEHGEDMTTSYHASQKLDLEQMIDDIDEQLGRTISKTTILDLLIYKQKLESLFEISSRLGSRKYAFEDST